VGAGVDSFVWVVGVDRGRWSAPRAGCVTLRVTAGGVTLFEAQRRLSDYQPTTSPRRVNPSIPHPHLRTKKRCHLPIFTPNYGRKTREKLFHCLSSPGLENTDIPPWQPRIPPRSNHPRITVIDSCYEICPERCFSRVSQRVTLSLSFFTC